MINNVELELTPLSIEDMGKHYEDLLALQDAEGLLVEGLLVNGTYLAARAVKTFGGPVPTPENEG